MNREAWKGFGIIVLIIAIALRVENVIKFLSCLIVGALAICIGYPHRELDVQGTMTPMVAKYVGKNVNDSANGGAAGAAVPTNQLLSDTIILITGATNGIGLAVTRHVCSNFGATVLALGRSADKLKSLQAEFPKQIKTFQIDQSDLASVAKCADEILKSVDKIHILVNNAGMHYGYGGKNENTEYYESPKTPGLDKVFVTNYLSHFLLTEKLAPLLQPQPISKAPAKIIQISSTFHWAVDGAQLMPTRRVTGTGGDSQVWDPPSAALPGGDSKIPMLIGQRSYGATKLAQIYHARALSQLKRNSVIASKNVEILSVCPTFVGTDIGRAEGDLMSKLMEIISFPVNGWGISSSLHAMFDTFYTNTTKKDGYLVGEGDFIRNTNTMVDIGQTSIPIVRDILTLINGFVIILFTQKFYANVFVALSSPESKNVVVMNDLYDWSLQTVKQYL